MIKSASQSTKFWSLLVVIFSFSFGASLAQSSATTEDWKELFNGKDINDWIVKIHRHETGVNYGNTFHVEDNSRLGCQIQINDDIDGIVLRLAPEEESKS